jgi:NAD(P)-dependent dehydrogenase (short-subunit alcohol dehydrogenase family)
MPLGRLLRPEEIAATALFLVSDESSGLPGSELLVGGGSIIA